MPSVQANQNKWASHDWKQAGEEWSTNAGGSARWWHGILLPRLLPILQALPDRPHILEIAPGHGRWTQYLLQHARALTAIDIDQGCLDACRKRFGDRVHLVLGDGHTLGGPHERINGPVDLCFSYDSLVHAEIDVMGSYLRELSRVLRPGGYAFVHHSNLAGLRLSPGTPIHWRAASVDAAAIRERALACGLSVPLQELCTKAGPKDRALIDCISVIHKPTSGPPSTKTAVLESPQFGHQVRLLGRSGEAYDAAVGNG
ncbi:MAG: class I SAM-dependent methyltransferase [Phycisphaerales bacterium]